MKKILLRSKKYPGRYMLVSDKDYPSLKKYKWYLQMNGKKPRATVAVYPGGEQVKLHPARMILKLGPREQADYIDGDPLNNQRSNIRKGTTFGNAQNRGLQKNNQSGVTGVYWKPDRGKWQAFIEAYGVRYNLGSYSSKDDAINARKRGEVEYFGKFRYRGKK